MPTGFWGRCCFLFCHNRNPPHRRVWLFGTDSTSKSVIPVIPFPYWSTALFYARSLIQPNKKLNGGDFKHFIVFIFGLIFVLSQMLLPAEIIISEQELLGEQGLSLKF